MSKPTAIIVGVGAELGVGAAVCRRFAAEGYHVVAAGRTLTKLQTAVGAIVKAGGSAEAVVADATKESDVIRLFDHAANLGPGFAPPDAVVFNAGINQHIDFRELTVQQFEDFWRICCFGGFWSAARRRAGMVPLGRGTVIFTGASASLRGKPGFAQFAAAKAGLRMISQSMARDYGKAGLHVAHAVIDGGIDGERLRSRNARIVEERGEDGLLDVNAIAETYWQIHSQPRSAWTQEIDLRPFKENY